MSNLESFCAIATDSMNQSIASVILMPSFWRISRSKTAALSACWPKKQEPPVFLAKDMIHRLSENFKKEHPEIEWQRIYGMRCHLVHGYEIFDAEIAWDSIEKDIPSLKECLDTIAY